MDHCSGWIVRSTAGHDRGTRMCVVGVDREADCLLVADGKTRKAASPKRKKMGHVEVENRGTFSHPVIEKLRCGAAVSDQELRRALAAFRDERDGVSSGQGGNHAWQKTI